MLIEIYEDHFINASVIDEVTILEEHSDTPSMYGKGDYVVIITCAHNANIMIKEISIAFGTYKEARIYAKRLCELTKGYSVH